MKNNQEKNDKKFGVQVFGLETSVSIEEIVRIILKKTKKIVLKKLEKKKNQDGTNLQKAINASA